jgi:flagellar hook-associated protein 1 FlgK
MSLFSAITTAMSGITAVTAQAQIVSDNISNATTTGYTEKGVTLAPTTTGGVLITGYTRSTDTAVFSSLCSALSDSGYCSTQNGYMQQLETILGTSGSSSDSPALETALTNFTSAWSSLEADPTNSSLQTATINAATNLVSAVQTISSQVDSLNTQINTDISSDCTDLNSDLQQVADLNTKIAVATSGGQPTGDLEDSRDALVQKIAAITNVQVITRSQGQIALYTNSGYALLDGSKPQTFAYDGTNVYSTLNPSTSLNTTLSGGSLQAAINFSATATGTPSTDSGTNVIQKVREQLNAFVSSLTTGTNTNDFANEYNSATQGTGESADFFTGTTTSDFGVDAGLVAGTSTIKQAAITPCETALGDATKSFSGGNLNLTNVSYATMVTGILSAVQTAASNISGLSTSASNTESYLSESYSNDTGVNSDSETVKLQTLENAYNATSHVIQVIETMFTDLEDMFSSTS